MKNNIKKIVKKYLIDNKHDGLLNEITSCQCSKKDLMKNCDCIVPISCAAAKNNKKLAKELNIEYSMYIIDK